MELHMKHFNVASLLLFYSLWVGEKQQFLCRCDINTSTNIWIVIVLFFLTQGNK